MSIALTLLQANAEDGDTTQLPGRSEQTRKRLAQAESTLNKITSSPLPKGRGAGSEGDATTATNQIQQIIDEAGSDWVEVEAGRFLPARNIAQQLLARLPVADLQRYRDRIDASAKKLLDVGIKNNDPAPLRELVTRYAVSRHAEPALIRLGDLALERGDARSAENYWSRLQSMPQTQIEPEMLQARIILARIFQNDHARAETLLKQLENEHPDAQGLIAGADGKLAVTLRSLLQNPPQTVADNGPEGWPTFGRTPQRVNRVTESLPYYWPDRPSWQVRFPTADQPNASTSAWQTAYHPVILGGVVYVAVADHILGYDIKTGTLQYEYNSRIDPRVRNSTNATNVPVERPQRLTLSISNDRIYARLGNPQISNNNDDSVIVELDSTLKPTHYFTPPKQKEEQAVWEGAPLCINGRLYTLFARFDGTRVTHVLACYDASSSELLWVRPLSNAPIDTGTPREEHLLLSYADGKILFASHSGVIVATDAETGEPAWAVQYPSSTLSISPYRSRVPAVADQGRVFVAPIDHPRILALDSDTGKTLWQSEELEIEQLLGVSWGRLIATIRKPNRGIRGFDAATGSDREDKGWRVHDDPLLQTFGLGTLSDKLILWPTRYGTFIMRSDTGTLVRQAMRGVRGNLIFADGVLLVATPTGLQGYLSDDLVEPPALSQTAPIKPDATTSNTSHIGRELVTPTPTIPDRPRWNSSIRLIERTELPTSFALPLPIRNSTDNPLSIDAPLLFITQTKLFRYDLESGQIAWTVPINSNLSPTSVQLFKDAILLIGRHGLAVHDLSTGKQQWKTSLPSEPFRPLIDGVTSINQQVLARVNESHLIAWDSATGRINWIRDSMNRPRLALFPMAGAPVISEAMNVVGDSVLAQTDQGKVMQWNLQQGTIRSSHTIFPTPWQSPPIQQADESIIYPTTPGELECHSIVTGKRLWATQLASPASRAGPMPQMRRIADELYVAISMNHDTELYKLNMATGQNSWPIATSLFVVGHVDFSNMAYDTEKLYLSTSDTLVAINRETGHLIWSQPWPSSIKTASWKLIVGQRSLLAYPSTPVPIDSVAIVLQRLLLSLWSHNPTTWLPLLPWNVYDVWMRRTLPLLQHDLETGMLRQRIDLDDVGLSIDVRLGENRFAIAVQGKIYWLTID